MTTTSPTTDVDAAAREARLRELYELIDSWGYDQFGKYFTEDLRFRFGNAAPITGSAGLAALSEQLEAGVGGISHTLHRFLHATDGQHVTVECEVTYTRLDGTTLSAPAAVVFRFVDSGLISDYRIYVDLAAL